MKAELSSEVSGKEEILYGGGLLKGKDWMGSANNGPLFLLWAWSAGGECRASLWLDGVIVPGCPH